MRARIARKPMFATDLDAALRSMRAVAEHMPTTVYVGHGGPLAAPSVAALGRV
ncbi:hypothetical protein HRW23_29360 [Streptomyces lunaelactis]|uniref:hypothetical protein n=1 Tax=Streptomyces lunaelactis TaxID=1535768 RepID=UPI00158518CD|nr:hypothetical protein [Streptomyces lunaelactis]NUK02566.1 hypothetical protein [Streptomyces lunaelactis]NUK06461.1 hypothetical protein [Streptomyces lunaelactis]NUK20217.1 hypothetical protein [Streptomyces lunaelactis]NUK38185.1 hypothetical protein [Streptomyces lunaelactis]NUK40600.1 hypothetical protein [Streptomyces lunaelactis]